MPQQPASSSCTVTPGIRCSSATVAAVPASAFWWQCPLKTTVRPASQLSSRSRNTIRYNATILPAYGVVLGLLALLGWVAIAAGTKPIGLDGATNVQLVIPQLFEDYFPAWFAGVTFAAVAIGALVPAAIMSIAAANTFTRNIYREWIKPEATHAEEARISKIVSLLVKGFALAFVLTLVLMLATPWCALALIASPLAIRAVGPVRGGLGGKDLIPVLRDTGLTMLVWSIVMACAVMVASSARVRGPGSPAACAASGNGSPSVCSTSNTYAARNPTTVFGSPSAGTVSRRATIGARIAMPFSPRRTKRPRVRHV